MCVSTGILVSITHFVGLVVEYVTSVVEEANEDASSEKTTQDSDYILQLVRYVIQEKIYKYLYIKNNTNTVLSRLLLMLF